MQSNRSWILFILLLFISGIWIYSLSPTVFWPGLIALAVFYIIVFAIGVWSEKNQDAAAFMHGGRKLPLALAILTMSATWVGGGFINGTAEYTASSGLIWVQAPWGYALSLIIGGLFFAKKMRRFQFRTMLDPLVQRFGLRSGILFFVPALLGELFWTSAILTALGTTFAIVIGIDTQSAIVISAAIAISYTLAGGFLAVVFTDTVQMLLLMLGLFMVVPFALNAVGGWSAAWESYEAVMKESSSFFPSHKALGNYFWNWWDYALLLIFGGIPWQVYFQRVLAAKDENTARWLSIIAGVVCIIAAIPAVMIGVVGAVADWPALGLSGPPDAASTLPYVIRHLTNPFIASIGLGAVAAAVMSSTDSSMLSASSMAGWNVYRPLKDPSMNAEQLRKVIRRILIIVGSAATLIALKVNSVYALWFLCSDLVYCLLFPLLVMALFDPKANKIGAVSGFVVALILRIGGGEAIINLPAFIPYPDIGGESGLFPFRTLAMLASLIIIPVISRLTQRLEAPRPLLKMPA